jgi:hypothetical protein
MSKKHCYHLISFLLLAGFLGGIFFMPARAGLASISQNWLGGQLVQQTNTYDEPTNQIFLPYLEKSWGQSIFGIELHSITDKGGLNQMIGAGAFWIRRNGLLWSDVESVLGNRNWQDPRVLALEEQMINANQAGMEVILIVRSTPEWARQDPHLECGRIKVEYISEFASFVGEAVERYSKPPYNVRFWQIWNEPDAPIARSEDPYGCWGNPDEPYFGAGYYTEVLKQVYPAIKQANPQAQVVVGGLLLPCDPIQNPIDCKQSTYLEGILMNGGKDFFDAVSFHAYDAYVGSGNYKNPDWASAWDTTGPVVAAKGDYLRGILNKYGAGNKLLLNSEGAIICGPFHYDPDYDEICTSEEFELAKAYYLTKSFASAISIGLDANIWYSITGWRYSGLVKSNLEPLPAYYAYQFARLKLGNAVFIEKDETQTNLFIYRFNLAGKELRLVWSKDDSPQTVSIPVGSEVWDTFGNTMNANGSVMVGKDPHFILFP